MQKIKFLLLNLGIILAMTACASSEKTAVTNEPTAIEASEETPVNENTAENVTETVEKKDVETIADEAISSQIYFNGSSTLGPVIAKIAQDFNEEYGTWDKLDPNLDATDISIYVAVGGSGQGMKSVIEKTADFGMLARGVKEKEKEALPNLQEYLVGVDALTIAVNKENPLAGKIDDLTTEEIQKIFSGEYKTWKDIDASLPDDEIIVIIRDIGGGAHSVFQEKIMGDIDVTQNAIQAPTMGGLVSKIIENKNAIGYASFGVIQQNPDEIVTIKVNGVPATAENILNGSYIIQRPLLLVIDGEPNTYQQHFLDVVLGEAGQTIVSEMGFIPAR